MVDFPQTVAVPTNYGPPIVDFSPLANAPNTYYQGQFNRQQQQLNDAKVQQAQQQVALSRAFPNGLPTDPRTGAIDYSQIATTLAKFGDIGGAMSTLQNQPAPMSPLFGGGGQPQGGAPVAPAGPAPSSVPAQPIAAPPAPQTAPSPSGSTVSAIASSVGAPATVAQNVARAVGVDPGAPLSDAQQTKASSLLQGYATRQSGARLERLQGAIFGQESDSGRNSQTSVTGARGGMQIEPETFKQYASAGENIDNPSDNRAVGNRILTDYWKRYGGDPARAAVAYFSGPGNVAPPGSPTPWKKDKADPTGKTVSSYVNDVLRKMGVGQLREAMEPANPRVAEEFNQLPPSLNAVSPRPSPPGSPSGGAAGAAGAPMGSASSAPSGVPAPQPQQVAQQPMQQPAQQQPAPQMQPQGQGPIVPPVPLPKGFTDPQAAIQALRTEAARLSGYPRAAGQVAELNDWASRIEQSLKPLSVNSMTTLVDRTGRTVFQGPGAAALAATEAAGASPTLDADAERYRQTGTLPPNMGRGMQGNMEARAIRARAAEIEIEHGGNPQNWPSRWQDYKATGVGKSAAERVRANREENLKLILRATEAAIPAALEASKALPRSDFVPLNKLIQNGQIMTSNPKLVQFGMANLQLAEHWARAMNPTGVMRESDRDKALSFLSTAYGNNTYESAVRQLETQIKREKTAVSAGNSTVPPGSDPVPGVSTSKADADGWTTLPNGARIREVK